MRKLLFGVGALSVALFAQPLRPVWVMGGSMTPTLRDGQFVWATRSFKELRRGDVVVFHRNGSEMVKRIAYLPGDVVRQYAWQGEWFTPRDQKFMRIVHRRKLAERSFVVPVGHVFVVGDNYGVSVDSRKYGPIPTQTIDAKVFEPPKTVFGAGTASLGPVSVVSRAGEQLGS